MNNNNNNSSTGSKSTRPSEDFQEDDDANKLIQVAILHSELGEHTLLLNIMEVLQIKNYNVKMFRPNCPSELIDSDKNENVHNGCSFFPRSIFGTLVTLCAYIRVFISAILIMLDWRNSYEYIIVDQLSFIIPILRMKCSKILFYCHDPEKLVQKTLQTTSRCNFFKKWARYQLNLVEEAITGMANTILVNSLYTQKLFQERFPIISVSNNRKQKNLMCVLKRHYPRILYPFINQKNLEYSAEYKVTINELLPKSTSTNSKLLTCIIQEQTNTSLALEAFANFIERSQQSKGSKNTYLVMASYSDIKLEVQKQAIDLKIDSKVIYVKITSKDDLLLLINSSKLLIYTN